LPGGFEVSGVVVTYNDAAHLEDCLSHLAFCDEIVVVDLGSTDDSQEIARTAGARLVHHERVPVVEMIREFAIAQAKYQWVVFVDPDMIFPERVLDSVIAAMRANQRLAQVRIPYRNYFLGRPVLFGRWGGLTAYPALMRKDRVHFGEDVHRGIFVVGDWETTTVGGPRDGMHLRHYWVDSVSQFMAKHERYIPFQAAAWEGEGRRFSRPRAALSTGWQVLWSLLPKLGVLEGARGLQMSRLWGWYVWRSWGALHDLECAATAGGPEGQR
jgi:glycosyltransferase involved in cell wall biosynthesis